MNIFLKLILTLGCLILFNPSLAGYRTEIKIFNHDQVGNSYRLNIAVLGALSNTEVLVFTENNLRRGLKMVSLANGEPYIAERQSKKEWVAKFKEKERVTSIYAISTSRVDYQGWGKMKDLYTLRRLGIENLGSINEVLKLLSEFGWKPTGYTFIGTTKLRSLYSPTSPSQLNTSDSCRTPVMSCAMGQYGSIGAPCWCNSAKGPIKGTIVRK